MKIQTPPAASIAASFVWHCTWAVWVSKRQKTFFDRARIPRKVQQQGNMKGTLVSIVSFRKTVQMAKFLLTLISAKSHLLFAF